MTNNKNLRFNICFYKIDNCVMNSCDSFRQKLIFDANDRKKKLKFKIENNKCPFRKK